MSTKPETHNQQVQSISEQFNTPPTSPWTEWADAFVRAAMSSNGSHQSGHNANGNGHQPANGKHDSCGDALMDCYNH